MPTKSSWASPSHPRTHPGSHSLVAELTPGTPVPVGKPPRPSRPPRRGPVQAGGVRIPPSASTAPRPSLARLCDGDRTPFQPQAPTAWLEMEHAPGGRGHGPSDQPRDGCTPVRTPWLLTRCRGNDRNLGVQGGPAAGAGDTSLCRAWVLMPRQRSSPARPGRGPVRLPRALTRAPVQPGRATPGSPRRLSQNA